MLSFRFFIVMLTVTMLSVFMLTVIILSVVAPFCFHLGPKGQSYKPFYRVPGNPSLIFEVESVWLSIAPLDATWGSSELKSKH